MKFECSQLANICTEAEDKHKIKILPVIHRTDMLVVQSHGIPDKRVNSGSQSCDMNMHYF